MTATQINFYQHTEGDPTRRSYVVGDDAASGVVAMVQKSGTVAVDIETAGLGADKYRVKVGIVANDRQSFVLDATNERHRVAFYDALRTAGSLIFHNSAFDVPPLVTAGMMAVDDIAKVFDTLVCARMAMTGWGAKRGLAELEKIYLTGKLPSTRKDRFADWAKTNGLTKSEAFQRVGYDHPVYQMYAGWDGLVTSMVRPYIYDAAVQHLTSHPFGRYGADLATAHNLIEREQRVNQIMLRRSSRGLVLDDERLTEQQDRLWELMHGHAQALAEIGVKDPSNRPQLATVLEAANALPEDYPRTPTGKISTAKANLDELPHPVVKQFVEYDRLRRLQTYLEHCRLVAARTDGRIHPQVNVLHARTGRMSYSDPELHQFLADARTVIRRDDDHSGLVSIDWSSIEPVTIANLSGDLGPIERFEAGEKLYDVISATAGVPYKLAKVVLLAALYGQGITSLSARLGMEPDEAKELQTQVFTAMPMTKRFVGWSAAWGEEVGMTWTLSGRIVEVDRDAGYKATNYSVQGSAYDVLAETVIGIDEAGLGDHLYLLMHDECIVSAEAAPEVRQIMERPPERLIELSGRVPILRTDAAFLGDHWDDADRHPSWPLVEQEAAA